MFLENKSSKHVIYDTTGDVESDKVMVAPTLSAVGPRASAKRVGAANLIALSLSDAPLTYYKPRAEQFTNRSITN